MSAVDMTKIIQESIVSETIEEEAPIVFITPFICIIVYLLTVLKIGPSLMKSRPAFQLKTFIAAYNIYQICACFYINFRIYKFELPALKYGTCSEVLNGTTAARDFDEISNFVFWLKVTELSETVVFVLRKKQSQVSFLHVFHHGTMVFLTYNMDSIYRNSSALFPVFLNSCVHIVMYTYYLLAALLPSETVARLTPFKKSITIMQMVQFAIVLFQIVIGMSINGCKVPQTMLVIYTVIIIVIFYGFYDFYKKAYNMNKKNKK